MELMISDLRNAVDVMEEYYRMILEQPSKGLASRGVTLVVKGALKVVLGLFNDLLEGHDEEDDGISPRELETTKDGMESLMQLAEHLKEIGQMDIQEYLELDDSVAELTRMCDALLTAHYYLKDEKAKQDEIDKKFEEIMREQS